MKRSTHKAFTLIELLLAVAIFAVVCAVATITFATTVRLQVAARQSQAITVQAQNALAYIGTSVRDSAQSGGNNNQNGLIVYQANQSQSGLCEGTSTVCNPQDAMIIANVPLKGDGGIMTGAYEKQVFCLAPVRSGSGSLIGKRLVRYTVAASAIFAAPVSVPECSPSGISALFTSISPAPAPSYLTDTSFSAISLRAWPIWSAKHVIPAGDASLIDPPALRLELTGRYGIGLGAGGGENRVADQGVNAPQIVIRSSVIRNLP